MFDPITVLTALAWLVIILNVADAVTTYMALQQKGTAEGNPIMKFFMGRLGLIGTLILTKGVVICALTWLTLNNMLIPIWIIGPLAAFYTWVVINNSRIIWKNRA